MDPSTVILETIHGSRLYGLAHEDSDHDIFRVVAHRNRALVTFKDGIDFREFSLHKFLEYVYTGAHQSCEALFSPVAYVHPFYAPMFAGMKVTGPAAFSKYRRTIRAFSYGDRKKRRHAVRIGISLAGLRSEGRFNPQLTAAEIALVKDLADRFEGDELADKCVNLTPA